MRYTCLEHVKISITGEGVTTDVLSDADWQKLYELACKQGVTCLAWRGIESLYQQGENICPAEVKLRWYARCKQIEQNAKKYNECVADFAKAVAPMKLAVLKGIDYARYWPNAAWREFGDLDVVALSSSNIINEEDAKSLDKKCKELGFEIDDDNYKHSEIRIGGLMVENHYYFTAFAGSKYSEMLERELRKLFAIDNLESENDDCPLIAPNREFTAVFMIAHAQNHFFYEGLSLRQILDWHFFLQKEGGIVDWKLVEDVFQRTKLKRFAVLLTQVCTTYFGLSFNPFGSELTCKEELINKFLDDVFSEHMSASDRRWYKMIERLWQRFIRNVRFSEISKMSALASAWKWISYASFFHRKPKLS